MNGDHSLTSLTPENMLKALSKSNRYPVPFAGATFHFRAMSGREFRALESIQGSKSLEPIFECVASALVGWEKVYVDEPAAIEQLKAASVELLETNDVGVFEVPFNSKHLDLILGADDVGELFKLMMDGNRPSKAELGKSDSPAPSTPA